MEGKAIVKGNSNRREVDRDDAGNVLHEPGRTDRKGFEANLLASQHRRAVLQAEVS